jgi:hypothetical protein
MAVPHSKVLRNVLREEAFYFFTSIGNYTGVSASSLDEFEQRLKDVDLKSLEFHLFREDFEKWIAQTLGDDKLAAEIKFLRAQKITGNALRDRLDFVVSRRLKELKSGVGSPSLSSASSSAWTSRERSPPSSDL